MLFAVLSGMMVATRHIDWYRLFERMRADGGASSADAAAGQPPEVVL